MPKAACEPIRSPIIRNPDNPTVAAAVALGCAAPAFGFRTFPELARCWLDRAEWLISHHDEMSPAERRRAIRAADLYSGATLRRHAA
jgi:hypothetical protein